MTAFREMQPHELYGDPRELTLKLTAGQAMALASLYHVADKVNVDVQIAAAAEMQGEGKAAAFLADVTYAVLRLYDALNAALGGDMSLDVAAKRAEIDAQVAQLREEAA